MIKHRLEFLQRYWAILLVFAGLCANAQTDVTNTYLVNASFDEGPIFDADTTANLGTANDGSAILEIPSWTGAASSWSLGATFEYGTSSTNNGQPVPATASDGTTSGTGHAAIGMAAAWGGQVTYSQSVTLPAGSYKIAYKAYNSYTDATAGNSLAGWVPGSGEPVLSSVTDFPSTAWIADTISFVLDAETSGSIQVGVLSPGSGSSSNARIFMDELVLLDYSHVAKLSALMVSVGDLDPAFNPDVVAYDLDLPVGTDSLILFPQLDIPGASYSGTDSLDVSGGGTGATVITVTAFDGVTELDYTVNYTVLTESTDASLSSLTTDIGLLSPAFHTDSLSYELLVPFGTTNVELTQTKNETNASVLGGGTIDVSAGDVDEFIVVTAEDGETTRTYTVSIEVSDDGVNYSMYLPGEDGNESHIDISGVGITSLPYTIEMWMKPDGSQTNNAGLLFNRPGNIGFQYTSWWQSTSQSIRYMSSSGDQYGEGTETPDAAVDTWHHIAVVLTDTSRTVYFDGEVKTEINTFSNDDFSVGTTYLGWDPDPESSVKAFKGWIDEVRVWSGSRTEEEILSSRYQILEGSEAGLLAYYSFDDLSGVATDMTSNGNDGTIVGGAYEEFVKLDQSITFDALVDVPLDENEVILTASSSLGLPVTYTSSDTDVATVSTDTLQLIAQGTTSITASQAGADLVNAAMDVVQPLNVLLISNDASLSNMTIDAGYMKELFGGDSSTLTVLVPAGVSSVTVSATPNDEQAVVTSGDGVIDVSGGSTSTTVLVTAEDSSTREYLINFEVDTENHMFGWDGDGATGAGSTADRFGWLGAQVWQEAEVGGVRYTERTYDYKEETLTSRVLFTRWDSDGVADINTVYGYPVSLEGGQMYAFKGKIAWHSNSNDPSFYFQINTEADNSGTSLAADTITTTEAQVLLDAEMTIVAPSTGVYYVTIASNKATLAGVTGLELIQSEDSDEDGVADAIDNCPEVPNADQADADDDGIGNVCDDSDGDGVVDSTDNCMLTANADQNDLDGDSIGDVCDDDRDGDGVANVEDAFPDDATETMDTDEDGIGNNADTDDDGDGQADVDEVSCGSDPLDANSMATDEDQDGIPDCLNTLQDTDGDGITDDQDNCPDLANGDQSDLDDDGVGDVCDDETVVMNVSESLSFGEVAMGFSSEQDLTISNGGLDDLIISEITMPAGFAGSASNMTIAAGQSSNVTITFTPDVVGDFSGELVVKSNAGDSAVAVIATGVAPSTILASKILELEIYPNPVTDVLKVNLSAWQDLNPSLSLMDINGKLIWFESSLKTIHLELDMTSFPEGIYFLKVDTKQGIETYKIIKQ